MWKRPIYEFKPDKGLSYLSYKSVKIDVTRSALNKSKPGKQLVYVFGEIMKDRDPTTTNVLDLGAARLRNSKFFVDNGFQVYCADFKELYKKGTKTEERLLELKRKKNFHQLIFPKDIYGFNQNFFDIILLLNVPTVMPIPVERVCLILIIRRLLKKDGIFLWYSDPMIRVGKNKYANRYTRKFLDGYLPGPHKKTTETFYVELHENEIETIIESCGFEIDYDYSKELKKFAYTNIVYSSKKKDRIIFSRGVNLEILINTGTCHKENYYISTEFKTILELLGEELKLTRPGKETGEPYRYHRIIAYILKNIFETQLTNMVIEKEAREGDMRIDITFRRQDTPGFFRELSNVYGIRCPYIIIECKNYSNDPGNKEYDQLDGRLNRRIGMFGILILRKIENKEKCLNHCINRNRDSSNNEKHIIVLEDSDILELIEARVNNPNEINDILHKKLEKIIF